ncbi:MAG: hypothetical protein MUD03_05740, partial [Pirellula sp.]|nr:hypothetical protein [Pirellula sp.]
MRRGHAIRSAGAEYYVRCMDVELLDFVSFFFPRLFLCLPPHRTKTEITELSKSDLKAADYYPAVLQKIIAALAAEGGAVWVIDQDGAMRLAHQIQLDPHLMQSDRPEAIQHGRLLSRLISQGRAELVPPQSGSGDPDGEANPTPHLLVTAPLIANKQPVGLLEILQRANSPAEAQRGYLRFL